MTIVSLFKVYSVLPLGSAFCNAGGATSMSFVELNNAQAGDEEAICQIKTVFQNVVNDRVESATAAQTIDKIIINDCQDAYSSYTLTPKPTNAQSQNGSIHTPDPAGWLQLLWYCFGKATLVVPYDHVDQNRLVSLLHELQRISLQKAPWFVFNRVVELGALRPNRSKPIRISQAVLLGA